MQWIINIKKAAEKAIFVVNLDNFSLSVICLSRMKDLETEKKHLEEKNREYRSELRREHQRNVDNSGTAQQNSQCIIVIPNLPIFQQDIIENKQTKQNDINNMVIATVNYNRWLLYSILEMGSWMITSWTMTTCSCP